MDEPSRPPRAPLAPLGVIAICFFLPCARGCNDPVAPSSALSHRDLWWVFPPFVAALVLAVALCLPWLLAAARRFETDLGAFAALGAWALSVPLFWLAQLAERERHLLPWVLASAPGTLGGTVLLFLASRLPQPRRGWVLVGSYTALAAGCPVTVVIAGELWSHPDRPLAGGVLYLTSLVALAALAIGSIRWRGRRAG